MDREPEELQFLGIFGIYNEAFKIIHSWPKLFAQLTVSLILPLSLIFLAHTQISDAIFTKIDQNEVALETEQGGPREDKILKNLSAQWAAFWLFKAGYLITVLVFSLLSTSGVVYAVASIYSGKDVSYRKVMSVVPKVWKRLMVTFVWLFVITVGYNFMSILIIVMVLVLLGGVIGVAAFYLLGFLYSAGMVYVSVVWHLASVVSVLEDKYGLMAMTKSKELIKGRLLVASAMFVKLWLVYMTIQLSFRDIAVRAEGRGFAARIGYGAVLGLLLCVVVLLGLVIQSIIYFVCKSYHHESIDKSCLSDHLEVYLGEYVPLRDRSIQMEQF